MNTSEKADEITDKLQKISKEKIATANWTDSDLESPEDGFEIIDKPNDSLCSVSADSYLSLPEEVLASATISELENAIENCKTMILSMTEDTEERKWLVRRLIELRLRVTKMKDVDEESSMRLIKENNKVVLGHHFSLQYFPMSTAHYYCDRCSGIIWNITHSWYLCSECDYKCHMKCLGYICRVCAHIVITEKPIYISDICPEPEDGLANQNYRCAECLAHTSFTRSRIIGLRMVLGPGDLTGNNILEPRLCDYTGKYYCTTCHWNSTSVIPARVIFNWDFKERNVCRSSKQILKLMAKLPILKLEELNPVLFACIEELSTVKELRQQLMQIKKYLTSCKSAVEGQLLWQSSDKIHFLENDDTYSLQDLLELRSGELIKYLNKIRDSFIRHIKVECVVCNGRGFICELCKDKKIIYPFEENVVSCTNCQSTFHFFCWVNHNQQCPKCNRIQARLSKNQSDEWNSLES